jgi:hypothetical protein
MDSQRSYAVTIAGIACRQGRGGELADALGTGQRQRRMKIDHVDVIIPIRRLNPKCRRNARREKTFRPKVIPIKMAARSIRFGLLAMKKSRRGGGRRIRG